MDLSNDTDHDEEMVMLIFFPLKYHISTVKAHCVDNNI